MKYSKELILLLIAALISKILTDVVFEYINDAYTDNWIISSKPLLKVAWITLLIPCLIFAYYISKYINKKFNQYINNKNHPYTLNKKKHKINIKKNIKKLSIFEKYILRNYYIKSGKSSVIFSEYSQNIDFVRRLCKKNILYTSINDNLSDFNLKLRERTYFIDKFAFDYLSKYHNILN